MIHLTASKVAGFQAGGDLLCPCPEGAALLHASTVLHACKTVYDPPGIWNVRNAELFKTIWHQWLSTMFATHKHMQFWGATGGAAVLFLLSRDGAFGCSNFMYSQWDCIMKSANGRASQLGDHARYS